MCEIGKKMFNRRKELGLTLEEVGNAVGVGKSTVRRWENGMIKNMGRDKIAALAKVLQMKSVEFIPIDDPAPGALSQEDQERLEALHQNPRLGLLFDHSRKMSKNDVERMIAIVDGILKVRDEDDE